MEVEHLTPKRCVTAHLLCKWDHRDFVHRILRIRRTTRAVRDQKTFRGNSQHNSDCVVVCPGNLQSLRLDNQVGGVYSAHIDEVA